MEDSIFETVVKAYVRYCQNNGLIYQQPNEALCGVDQKYVHLEISMVLWANTLLKSGASSHRNRLMVSMSPGCQTYGCHR